MSTLPCAENRDESNGENILLICQVLRELWAKVYMDVYDVKYYKCMLLIDWNLLNREIWNII